MPKPKPKPSNKPFTPRGAELGPLPMPAEEEIVAELIAEAGDAGTDHFYRCQSRNPKSSPWAIEVSAASAMLCMMDIRARCTLPAGHAGDHVGPDDVTWPRGQEETDL